MPQLMNNSKQDTSSVNSTFGNPLNLLKALSDLAQSSQQVESGANIVNKEGTQSAQRNAYQKGVEKALKQAGESHTVEAIQQGVPAEHIVEQAGLTQQPQQNDPIQILSGLISMAGQNKIDTVQQNNAQQPVTSNYSYQPDNPIAKFFNMIGFQPTPENQVLLTQAQMNRQKMSAGLPSEIALPQAQAALNTSDTALKQAELAAGAPQANVDLTKQNIEASKQEKELRAKDIQAGIYKTQSEREIQHIQRLTERRKQVLDQMNEDLQHGPIINRGDRLKEYRRQLNWYDKQLNESSGTKEESTKDNFVKPGQSLTINGKTIKRLN